MKAKSNNNLLNFKTDNELLIHELIRYFRHILFILSEKQIPMGLGSCDLLNYIVSKIIYDLYGSFNSDDLFAREIIELQQEFMGNLKKDLSFIEYYDFKYN